MFTPIVGPDCFVLDLDEEIRRSLRSRMPMRIKGKGDVSKETVRLCDRGARQVMDLGRWGIKCGSGGFFCDRERICLHASSRRPAAYHRSTGLVICRAKIASMRLQS